MTPRPCAISLDRKNWGGGILIFATRIVAEVVELLEACEPYGRGGWAKLDGYQDWIVIVSGDLARFEIANGSFAGGVGEGTQ